MQEPRYHPADFGFRTVPADEKAGLVHDVFERVARRYDLMNDLMSMGVHRLWKAAMLDALNPRPGTHLLDVAGGTGDIAFRFLDRCADGQVTVCDINDAMVSVGRDRAIDQGRITGIDWVVGDAERIPLPDMSVNACTIAFGLRNVTRIDEALKEMRRVLKPGGRFLCLEFSKVVVPMLDKIYDTYSFEVLPRIGAIVAKDRDAYVYLVESIRRFPPQEELEQKMRAAGFDRVSHRNMSGGIVALHSGWRL